MPRCVIIDDDFLQAARCPLEWQGVAVVGVASDSARALLRVERLRPDVVLVDIGLGAASGLELARRLESETGPSPCPGHFGSNHTEEDYAALIEESTAFGFLGKADLSGDAIRTLLAKEDDDHQGGSVIEPRER
jgi:DNA-binding NarL/FixJ family response regulator